MVKLGRVDPCKANAGAVDVDCIAVYHPAAAPNFEDINDLNCSHAPDGRLPPGH